MLLTAWKADLEGLKAKPDDRGWAYRLEGSVDRRLAGDAYEGFQRA